MRIDLKALRQEKAMKDIFADRNEPISPTNAKSEPSKAYVCPECKNAGIVHKKFGDVKTCQTCLENGRWTP